MTKTIRILLFHLKNKKWIYLGIFILLYGVVLPFFIQQIHYAQTMNYDIEMQCSTLLQKFLLIIVIMFQSFMFETYVEIDMRELTNVLDRLPKFIYLCIDWLCFQIVLCPLYFIINYIAGGIIQIIIFYLFQSMVLNCLYYVTSMICKSSLLTLGIILCYCLIFIVVGGDLSIFVIDFPIRFVEESYYAKLVIVSLLCIAIGRYFEKKY